MGGGGEGRGTLPSESHGISERKGPEQLHKSTPLVYNEETKAHQGEGMPQVTVQIPRGHFKCIY